MKELFAICMIFYVLYKGLKYGGLNPYILSIFFPVSLCIYSHSIGGIYLPELSYEFVIWVTIVYICYVFGVNLTINWHVFTLRDRRLNLNILFGLGILPHIVGFALTGFPIFSDDIELARQTYKVPVLSFFHVFLFLGVYESHRMSSLKQSIIAEIILVFFSLVMLSKFDILMACLVIITARSKSKGEFRIFNVKRLLATIFGVLIIFTAVSMIRSGDSLSKYSYISDSNLDFVDVGVLQVLLPPYYYMTTGLSNLYLIYESDFRLSLGSHSIYPLVSLAQLDHLVQIDEKIIRLEPFNTHTYIADFLLDFGRFGAAIASLLLGGLVGLIYRIHRMSSNSWSSVMWGYCALAVLSLPFSNHFTSVGYPLIYMILLLAFRLTSNLI